MDMTPSSTSTDAFRPPELKSIFTGEHAWCGEKMMLSRDLAGAQPLAGFFASAAFAGALDRYAQTHGGHDRRAVVSMWSLYYFAALTIPFIVARRADYVLPIDLDRMTIALADDGLPRAFGLETEGDWSEGNRQEGVDGYVVPLVHQHLAAVVAALKSAAGLAPKLAWNNAAVYIDYAFNTTAPTRDSDGWAARQLFEQPALADGTANPFRGCLRHEPAGETTVCRRKVCCLRYLLPGIPSCGALCALPSQRGPATQQGH
ncbi:siderophore-iron reductase FhuF [Rhizobium sp. Leaf341]|uniref:siderophore-iron reductase FhuF n=1 Tax=Rhizobium sp. Leaf341 TaxID=1736344 RepID=UPI0009E7CB74|nr:siderophore-iron reductase FhuF [Rhizobium sp. Leaf341]